MIGIFDSGVGGLASYREVRRLLPKEDIVYLADRANAPYGTKTEEELINLVTNDIKRLYEIGCENILIACCTASTVYEELPEWARCISTPIIRPAAMAAADEGGKIAVIATERTVMSGAFKAEINRINPEKAVYEIEAQRLVELVEGGERDGQLSRRGEVYLDRLAEKIAAFDCDILIYGCTHFSHVSAELGQRLCNVKPVLPAIEGARLFAKIIKLGKSRVENGRCIYI